MILSAVIETIKILLAEPEGCNDFPEWEPNAGAEGDVECGDNPVFDVGHVCNWTCPAGMY